MGRQDGQNQSPDGTAWRREGGRGEEVRQDGLQAVCVYHETGSQRQRQSVRARARAYLEAGSQAVHVVSSVTAVTQQHGVRVSLAAADLTARVEQRARPHHTPLQGGQMDKHLTHTHTLYHQGCHGYLRQTRRG